MKINSEEDIGKELKQLRGYNTLRQVAERSGRSENDISRYEKGKSFNVSGLNQYLKIYGLELRIAPIKENSSWHEFVSCFGLTRIQEEIANNLFEAVIEKKQITENNVIYIDQTVITRKRLMEQAEKEKDKEMIDLLQDGSETDIENAFKIIRDFIKSWKSIKTE